MFGGRLLETENVKWKRICQMSGLKSGRGPLEIWVVVAYKRALETVFNWETKGLFTKWSLTGGGRLREVVALRELTVLGHVKLTWNVAMIQSVWSQSHELV